MRARGRRRLSGALGALSLACALSGWLAPSSTRAHPLSPAALVIQEEAPNVYAVQFRRSELAVEQMTPVWPAACRAEAPRSARVADQVEDRFTVRCSRSLAGQPVQLVGLAEASLSAVLYAEFSNGQRARGLLTPAHPSFVLPRETSAAEVFADYLKLGIEHLLTGWDHLLFILGLMFLARGLRALVWTLSAFTLGHSVTLCLAALSLVSVPQPPVELGIAVSLLVLALALSSPAPAEHRAAETARDPRGLFGVAFALGLLHGLGFAGALAETGLPQHQIALSLLGFNLGVECGQLAVVIPLTVLRRVLPVRLPANFLRRSAAYVIGGMAACWCIERALAWIG